MLLSQQALAPAPQVNCRTLVSAVAGSVAAQGAAPAFTDEIGDAAKLPSDASCPSSKEIDWGSDVYNGRPGNGSAVDWLKAVDKAFVMGATLESKMAERRCSSCRTRIQLFRRVDSEQHRNAMSAISHHVV